jgi:hypothetical protein
LLSIAQIGDRAEIDDVINRMAWCQDRRDWEGLDDVLAAKVDPCSSRGLDIWQLPIVDFAISRIDPGAHLRSLSHVSDLSPVPARQ